jgi:hypothetical protein
MEFLREDYRECFCTAKDIKEQFMCEYYFPNYEDSTYYIKNDGNRDIYYSCINRNQNLCQHI